MTIQLFKKPVFDRKKYVKDLDAEILKKSKELEAILNTMENPFAEQRIALDKREAELNRRERDAFQKEVETANKLSSLEDMAGELGEKTISLLNKEKMLNERERNIKVREDNYLIKTC